MWVAGVRGGSPASVADGGKITDDEEDFGCEVLCDPGIFSLSLSSLYLFPFSLFLSSAETLPIATAFLITVHSRPCRQKPSVNAAFQLLPPSNIQGGWSWRDVAGDWPKGVDISVK
ncbi:hypothetical protein TIFTF001_030125 [Ficus carica]|uniref:Uncharacterized protein n=1 Tax=Ficus carica TaxID=3494 RepID=A0AA88J3Q1_FICCA|nr:hypothetical protein TIFTF001_030125 [Ficus carica]